MSTFFGNSEPTSNGMDWYVVETLSRREQMAIQNLERQRMFTFWPRFWKIRRHARRQDNVLVSLFPGYVFVQTDPREHPWRPINGTLGVKRLVVGATQYPQPMPQKAMDCLFSRCKQGVLVEQVSHFLPGSQARVVGGPFSDQMVSIECMDGKDRVKVLLELLGSQNSITMHAHNLTPA